MPKLTPQCKRSARQRGNELRDMPDRDTLYEQAFAAYKAGQGQRAEKLLTQSLRNQPNDPRALLRFLFALSELTSNVWKDAPTEAMACNCSGLVTGAP